MCIRDRSIIDAIQNKIDCRLVSIQGGDKHNAIPREAFATILISPEAVSDAQIIVSERNVALTKEFGSMENNLKVNFSGLDDSPDTVIIAESQTKIVGLLRTLPHGVLKYSHDVEGLVETSNNLASVNIEKGNVIVTCSTRSSIAEALELQRERIEIMGKVYGARVEQDEIKKSSNVANPGCFATAILLGLSPSISNGLVNGEININATTGSTGAGIIPSEKTHFSWRNNNLSWYKPFTHQHLGEVKETLHQAQGKNTEIIFLPQRGNFTRGIFATAYTFFEENLEKGEFENIKIRLNSNLELSMFENYIY